ncbi:hypothetical protein [Arthrobacter burdickii]|uniref:DUF4352 domain-containing protein n=1 Tax=Arthrobacter burdickii TaxID=3035920 RepID=A0ABT8K0V3_9MICC|nr:hypothetical protein [Arthrobacter burdickii]MDN4611063.1 hypothetical protein [Arthrobacter burdickii]
MKRRLALTTALIMGLGLTGCSGSTPTVTPASEAPAADAAATSAPAETTEAVSSRTAAFGDTVTFDSGVAVTVTFDGFKPASPSAYGAVEGQYAVFTITAVNNSAEEIEAGIMGGPTVRVGAAGTQAQLASDVEVGIGSSILSTMLPGSTQTGQVAYGIAAADAGQIQMEIMDPSFSGKDAIFQGSLL